MMVTVNDSALGHAYGFPDIASLDDEVWVVFAVSEHNSEILRLAPVFVERRTSDSVPIASERGEHRWMLPGVEIAIHRVDLNSARLASGSPFSVVRGSEKDDQLRAGEQADDSNMLEQLYPVAEEIEARFHHSLEFAAPHLSDCLLDMIDPTGPSATFTWSQDNHRSYRLERSRDTWTLTQCYDDPFSVEEDLLVPLDTGKELVCFNSLGLADLSVAARTAIRAQFKFEFLANAVTAPRQNIAKEGAGARVRRTVRMILTLPSSIASGMALPLSFSTSAVKHGTPEHCLRQSTPIGAEGSGETLEVVCESYADYPNSVDMKVAIVTPDTLKVGDHVEVTLGCSGINPLKVEFTLKEHLKGGLRDRQLIAMPWERLMEYCTADGLEIEIDLPPKG